MASRRLSEAGEAERLILHLGGLGRIDLTGALVLKDVMDEAKQGGFEVELVDVPEHAERILGGVIGWRPSETKAE